MDDKHFPLDGQQLTIDRSLRMRAQLSLNVFALKYRQKCTIEINRKQKQTCLIIAGSPQVVVVAVLVKVHFRLNL